MKRLLWYILATANALVAIACIVSLVSHTIDGFENEAYMRFFWRTYYYNLAVSLYFALMAFACSRAGE